MALPSLPPLPAAGQVPATFRSEGAGDPAGPRLGALSLSAVLAVALAALRGTVGVVQDWRQRRLERQAETAPLRAARLRAEAAELRHGGTGGRVSPRVPSSHDWGRRTLQRSPGGSTGSSGGGGRSGSGGTGGSGPSRSTRSTPTTSGSTGGTSGRSSSGGRSGGTSTGAGAGTSGPGRSGHGSRSSSSGTGPGRSSSPASGGTSRTPGRTGGGGSGQGTGAGRSSGSSAGSAGSGSGRGGGLGRTVSAARTAAGKVLGKGGGKSSPGSSGTSAGTGSGTPSPAANGGTPGAGATAPTGTDRKTGTGTGTGKAGAGRTTLGQALTEEAARRFEGRRAEGLRHPWRADQDAPDPGLEQDADTAQTPGPGHDTEAGSADQAPPGGPGTGQERRQEAPAGDPGEDPFDDGGDFWMGTAPPPPPGGGRRSAWESMQDAAAAADATDVTVESLHVPGDSTRRARYARAATRGLPVAEPGTTTSKTTTTREAPVSAPLTMPGPSGAAPEHLTEITLDDVLEALAASRTRCFATYDECAALADKAVRLRAALAELAEELAERHNVIGDLTSAAMVRLSESMDVLARRAEEMRGSSLHAAEAVETAHDAMHDAYRPVQQAAADAGLSMPSARIHNEE
ncbi:hypothetical protein [Streptomyces taklimakanensis]|uniref:hypothetical protein n=1 Tax=Streptomyces taklimakanensis TaxID=2569853 RepID=UPI00192E5EA5